MKGYIDTHNHILPGLDDGADTLHDAILMARIAERSGIGAIIATPHYNEYHYSSAREALAMVEVLQKRLQQEGIGVTVYPGNELRIHPELPRRLKTGEVLPLAASAYILLEFPFADIPVFAEDVVFRLRTDGWVPILAHCERIHGIQRKPDRLKKFIDMGCLVQMNTQSITGELDRASRNTAVALLKRGWVDIMATDAHSPDWRTPDFTAALTATAKLIGRDAAERLVCENPARILAAQKS